MNTRLKHLGWAMAAAVLGIAACGGGGDDTTPTPGGVATGGDTSVNPFAAMVGNWSSGCVDTTYVPPPGSVVGGPSRQESTLITGVVSNPTGADKAMVSIDAKNYNGSTCAEASMDQHFTASGQVTALPETKLIAGDVNHPKTGTAKIANFKLDGFTLHNVTLSFATPLGSVNKVGYMFDGVKLYGVKGGRQADGLGSRFGDITLTRK